MTLTRITTLGLAAVLLAGPAVAQSTTSQAATQTTAPDAPASGSTKDQRHALKKQENASKQQAKSDKAQRKALQQQEKAQKAAAKAGQ